MTGAEPMIPDLAGLTAGAPQRCVPIQRTEALRLEADQTILYGRGGLVWVNRLGDACIGRRRIDVLTAEPIGASYCRSGRTLSADPVTGERGPAALLQTSPPTAVDPRSRRNQLRLTLAQARSPVA